MKTPQIKTPKSRAASKLKKRGISVKTLWTAPRTSRITPPPSATKSRISARIAQLVEQRIENPRVGGSNPSPGTTSSL